jgi:phosphopentomutase
MQSRERRNSRVDIKRVFLIVLDSFGIGELPDADQYGDAGSNTLASIAGSQNFHVPNLEKLGLFNIDGVTCGSRPVSPMASFARMAEKSAGKDTTMGHWEISGIISENPLPTFPNGFPESVIRKFEELTGRGVLCNKPYSGTKVIADFGKKHLESGKLIVYTSADSVFQIAAHDNVVPVEQLYTYCRTARKMLTGKFGVGRVIARPFTGKYPHFQRTTQRHDFSIAPPRKTMLDFLSEKGYATIAVGKINDIFSGRGITSSFRTANNTEGMKTALKLQQEDFNGLCFINLVDFDMLYGHRNDVDGYARAMTEFDQALTGFLTRMQEEDLLIITADHGCDPMAPGTDHSREYVPMIAYGQHIKSGVNLKTRNTFADLGATVLNLFHVGGDLCGSSFYRQIVNSVV